MLIARSNSKGMLMTVVVEVTALLEKLPLWKRLKTLQNEVEDLKAHVAQLEARVAGGGAADICPKCRNSSFEINRTENDPTFGDLGVQRRVYVCAGCGHTEYKQLR